MTKVKLSYYQRALIHEVLDKMIDWGVEAVNGKIVGKSYIQPRVKIGDSSFVFTVEPEWFGEKTARIYERKLKKDA